jgi:hypothetical protein
MPVPAEWAGVVNVMAVSLTIVKLDTELPPNVSVFAVRKPVPLIVTVTPPVVGPIVGENEVIVGAFDLYVM